VKFDNSLLLFQHLLRLDENKMLENLPAFIQEDDKLYSETSSLIDAHYKNQKNTQFNALIGGQADSLVENNRIFSLEGTQVGLYKLTRKLGHGGMGAVYLGERNDGQLEHKVAIKFVYPSIATLAGENFLQKEAQHLANLDHTNIAKLHTIDATENGMPYMVMEYVDGLPIDSFCDQNNLDLKARLKLFQKVCNAVHEAHQNMVIHADIKPSNILVDKQGEPKLMDFGIARYQSHSSEPADDLPSSRSFLAASRGYASPEQINGESITTSSDVYSLGKVLRICTSQTEKSSEIDAIIKCACSISPNERFDTAHSLSASISDFLSVRPLLWYRSDPIYKYTKWLKRAPVSAISSIFLPALLLFIGITLSLQNNQLIAANQKNQNILNFYENILSATSPSLAKSENLSAADLLKYGTELIGKEHINDPITKTHILITLANSLLNLGLIIDAENVISDLDYITVEGQLIKAKIAFMLGRHDQAVALIQSEDNNLTRQIDALLILAKISAHQDNQALTQQWLVQAKLLGGNSEQQFKRLKVALEIAIKFGSDEVRSLLSELQALDNSDITQVWYKAFLAQQYIIEAQLEEANIEMHDAIVLAEKIYHNTQPDLASLYGLAFNVAINNDDQRPAERFLNKQMGIYRQLLPNYQNELLNLYLQQFNLYFSAHEFALARTYNTFGVQLCGESKSDVCQLFLEQEIKMAFRLSDYKSVIEAVEQWKIMEGENTPFNILCLTAKSYLALNDDKFENALSKLTNFKKNSHENAEYVNILVISGRAQQALSEFKASTGRHFLDEELLAYTNAYFSIGDKEKASDLLNTIDQSKLSIEQQHTAFELSHDNSSTFSSNSSQKTKFTYQLPSGYQLLKSRRVHAVTSPSAGDNLTIGEKHWITWQANKMPGEKVAIFINGKNNFDTKGFSTWQQIQSIKWKLASQDNANVGELKIDPYHFMANGRHSYKVLIVTDLGYWAISGGLFSIVSGVSINNGLEHHIKQTLLVDSMITPKEYQVYRIGETDTIEWNNDLLGGKQVSIYVLHDDSSNIGNKLYADSEVIIKRRWYNIVINAPNTGEYLLDPSQFNGQGNAYKILIIADNGKWSVSNERFTVVNPH
jgi:serine/threonine-protein kinase